MKELMYELFDKSKYMIKTLVENGEVKEFKAYVLFETMDILVLYMELKEGQSLAKDKHSILEVVFCIEGEITYEVDKQIVMLEAHSKLQIEPYTEHACTAGREGTKFLAMLTQNQYFESFFRKD